MRPIEQIRKRLGEPHLVVPVWGFNDYNIAVTCYRSPGLKMFIIVEHKGTKIWRAYMPLGMMPITKEESLDKLLQFLAHPSFCDEDQRLGICDYCEHAEWNHGKCEIGRTG